MIDVGDQLTLPASGRVVRVERLIGEGSQGSVFEAHADDGQAVALKWYFEHTGTPAQRAAIRELVQRGAPSGRAAVTPATQPQHPERGRPI